MSNEQWMSAKSVYIASKTKYAPLWRQMRDEQGIPIIGTWIDEAGAGETSDFADRWRRCIAESSSCDLFILFVEPDDHIKGALVELGVALHAERSVAIVGDCPSVPASLMHHPNITRYASVEEALAHPATRHATERPSARSWPPPSKQTQRRPKMATEEPGVPDPETFDVMPVTPAVARAVETFKAGRELVERLQAAERACEIALLAQLDAERQLTAAEQARDEGPEYFENRIRELELEIERLKAVIP
jgi:hypothetical protein